MPLVKFNLYLLFNTLKFLEGICDNIRRFDADQECKSILTSIWFIAAPIRLSLRHILLRKDGGEQRLSRNSRVGLGVAGPLIRLLKGSRQHDPLRGNQVPGRLLLSVQMQTLTMLMKW